jgi:hypothetical protein
LSPEINRLFAPPPAASSRIPFAASLALLCRHACSEIVSIAEVEEIEGFREGGSGWIDAETFFNLTES